MSITGKHQREKAERWRKESSERRAQVPESLTSQQRTLFIFLILVLVLLVLLPYSSVSIDSPPPSYTTILGPSLYPPPPPPPPPFQFSSGVRLFFSFSQSLGARPQHFHFQLRHHFSSFSAPASALATGPTKPRYQGAPLCSKLSTRPLPPLSPPTNPPPINTRPTSSLFSSQQEATIFFFSPLAHLSSVE